jgi:hypothetical protein
VNDAYASLMRISGLGICIGAVATGDYYLVPLGGGMMGVPTVARAGQAAAKEKAEAVETPEPPSLFGEGRPPWFTEEDWAAIQAAQQRFVLEPWEPDFEAYERVVTKIVYVGVAGLRKQEEEEKERQRRIAEKRSYEKKWEARKVAYQKKRVREEPYKPLDAEAKAEVTRQRRAEGRPVMTAHQMHKRWGSGAYEKGCDCPHCNKERAIAMHDEEVRRLHNLGFSNNQIAEKMNGWKP